MPYAADAGTELGIIRDGNFGGFIPHDHDVDLIMDVRDIPRLVLQLNRLLPDDLVISHELIEGKEAVSVASFNFAYAHLKIIDANTCMHEWPTF